MKNVYNSNYQYLITKNNHNTDDNDDKINEKHLQFPITYYTCQFQ